MKTSQIGGFSAANYLTWLFCARMCGSTCMNVHVSVWIGYGMGIMAYGYYEPQLGIIIFYLICET